MITLIAKWYVKEGSQARAVAALKALRSSFWTGRRASSASRQAVRKWRLVVPQSAGQPPVEQLHVLPALDIPGKVLSHAVEHQALPGGFVLVGVEGGIEGPAQALGRVVLEDEAGTLAGRGVEGLDGIGQAAG